MSNISKREIVLLFYKSQRSGDVHEMFVSTRSQFLHEMFVSTRSQFLLV